MTLDDGTVSETVPFDPPFENSSPAPMCSDRRIQLAKESFYSLFKYERSETEGKNVFELGAGPWNIPSLNAVLDALFKGGASFHDLQIAQDFPRVGHKDLLLQATATRLAGSGAKTVLLAAEDFTTRKQTDDRLRYAEAKYQHLPENANDGILIVNGEGMVEFANRRVEAMFGP